MMPGMTRRAAIAGMGAAAAIHSANGLAGTVSRKPNILFIMADDLGYADLSCYGRDDYQTPVLDGLAAQGMRFTSAYANSAVCTATRTALITGRYQYRLPIGLEEPLAARDVGLEPSHPTIASLLRVQGYHTSLIGKWRLGSLPRFGPLKSGYDEFWGIRSGGVDYFTHKVFGAEDLWDGTVPIERSGYLTDLLGQEAVGVIEARQRDRKPWFMSLHFTAPHWPWEGPDDRAESDRLEEKGGRLPIIHLDGGTMAAYAEMVTRMDYQIGQVLAAVDCAGMADNTIIVFTSDNGGERFSKNWPFSGHKGKLLEGGLRIPAIVRWPGIAAAGSTSDAQIMSMDWLPTLVAAAGGEAASDHPPDGIDIRSALAGCALPQRPLFWRYKYMHQRAVRLGRHKYLQINGNEFLFDVVADPLERGNLKEREPDRFAALKQLWAQWDAQMLPLDPQSYTHGYSAQDIADHFGVENDQY